MAFRGVQGRGMLPARPVSQRFRIFCHESRIAPVRRPEHPSERDRRRHAAGARLPRDELLRHRPQPAGPAAALPARRPARAHAPAFPAPRRDRRRAARRAGPAGRPARARAAPTRRFRARRGLDRVPSCLPGDGTDRFRRFRHPCHLAPPRRARLERHAGHGEIHPAIPVRAVRICADVPDLGHGHLGISHREIRRRGGSAAFHAGAHQPGYGRNLQGRPIHDREDGRLRCGRN